MIFKAFYDKMLKYSNRIIVDPKQFEWTEKTTVSFNGNDGVNATIVYNLADNEQIPTYIQIVGGTFDGYQYYVIGYKFIRKQQYTLTLIRDLISESDKWKDALSIVSTGLADNSAVKYRKHSLDVDIVKCGQEAISNQYADDGSPLYSVLFYYSMDDASDSTKYIELSFKSFTPGDLATCLQYDSDTEMYIYKAGSGVIYTSLGFYKVGCFAIRYVRPIDFPCVYDMASRYFSSDEKVIDVQICPMCIPNMAEDGGNIPCWTNVLQQDTTVNIPWITGLENNYTGTFGGTITDNIGKISLRKSITGKFPFSSDILHKECNKIRINTPSFSNTFEMTPYFNDSTTSIGLEYLFAYKPFASNILVKPIYNEGSLYGNNYTDSRGLMYNHSTNVNKVDDAYIQFKRNNQMYESVFNEQMRSLELQQSWEQRVDKYKYDTSGTVNNQKALEAYKNSMGMVGKLTLDLPATILNSLDGGGYKAQLNEGSKLDWEMSEALRGNAKEYAQKMQSLQIATLKSTPVTVSKVDGFTAIDGIGFILEYFSTTETGAKYLESYYKYNGDPINMIGTIRDYYGKTITAQIIFSNDYSEVEIKELNERLQGGILTNGIQ